MITVRECEGSFMIDFLENEDWDGFDIIMSKLRTEFDASILERIDGPESRIWHIEIDGIPLSLHNNPYGNYLKASSLASINYLKGNIDKYRIVFY